MPGGDTLRKPRTDAFQVFWKALHSLFKRCIRCGKPLKVTKLFIIGSVLTVNLQKLINCYYNGNITFDASVLFNANTFQNIQNYFRLAKVAFISESSCYEILKKCLFPVANKAWLCKQNNLLDEIRKKREKVFRGDGCCECPGNNAKYLSYSFLDQELRKL